MGKILHVLTIALIFCTVSLQAPAQNDQAERYLRQQLPERWTYTPEIQQTMPSDDQWWKNFDDALLDSLISMGIDNNFNLSEAAHRREVARLTMQQAKAAYYPSLTANATYSRSRLMDVTSNNYSLGADMNWEIDVFGKITSGVKARKAAYKASRAEYVGAMISLTAQIATYYVDFRVLQARLAVAEEHIQSQERVLKIAEARHEAGLVSKLDVAQAKTVYYQTRATLPALRSSLRQTLNALAVLVGRYPDQIAPMFGAFNRLPAYNHIIPAGVPMNLLRRRPDIVEAEATLAQYAAQLGVAKKDFLPTLSLTGSIGFQHTDIDDLFTKHGFHYAITPTLSWTIFDGFSRKYAVAQAKEEMMMGIDAYNLTVMTAVQEVDNAIVSYQASLEEYNLDKEVYAQAVEEFNLSMEQYKTGLASFTTVVDAQIDWLTCANSMVVAQGNALISLIDLYKALGGSPSDF